MQCPKCQNEIHEMRFEGVDLDFCSSCKGMWFDKDEMAFLAELPSDIPNLADVKNTSRTTPYDCPRCGVKLEEMKFVAMDELRVERCPQCQGIWLDKGELPKVEHIGARISDPKSKLLMASKQLQAKGYQILGGV